MGSASGCRRKLGARCSRRAASTDASTSSPKATTSCSASPLLPVGEHRPVRPQGFSKAERIRRSDDFTRILKEGKRLRGRLLDVRWCTDDEPSTDPNRVGVAVGRRIGNAVIRNRLKRRIREAYRRCKGELPCRGIEMVVLATPQLIDRRAPEVEEELRRLLQGVAASCRGA